MTYRQTVIERIAQDVVAKFPASVLHFQHVVGPMNSDVAIQRGQLAATSRLASDILKRAQQVRFERAQVLSSRRRNSFNAVFGSK